MDISYYLHVIDKKTVVWGSLAISVQLCRECKRDLNLSRFDSKALVCPYSLHHLSCLCLVVC